MSDGIKVTCTDLESGETVSREVPVDDYMVICTGNHYIASTVTHKNGTHVVTIKAGDPS